MTFDYGYRDSSNARLTGVIVASSRDDAYRQLKEKGVRPTFVTLAPDLKNRLLSLGKRGWSIVVLCVLCLVLCAVAVRYSHQAQSTRHQAQSPLTRRQIYGDPALMEKLQLENYASLFADEGDRVLAHFAQPALIDRFVATLRRNPAARAAAAEALSSLVDAELWGRGGSPRRRWTSSVTRQAAASPKFMSLPPLSPSSLHLQNREHRELLRIVLWLRSEFSAYLAAGTGTPETYLARLLERQQYEADFYARAKRELEGVTDPAVYEKRNDELRAIGAPTIPLPLAEEE